MECGLNPPVSGYLSAENGSGTNHTMIISDKGPTIRTHEMLFQHAALHRHKHLCSRMPRSFSSSAFLKQTLSLDKL